MAGPLLPTRPDGRQDWRSWLRRPTRWISCPTCGTANDAAVARWCGHCGERLQRATQAQAAAPRGPDLDRVRQVAGPAFIALLVLAVVVPSALQGGDGPSRGQTARGDAGRTGVVASQAPVPPREVAWSTDPTPIDLGTTLVSSAGVTVSVLSGDRFEVLDLATGAVVRSVDLEATRISYGFATVADDLLLTPGEDLDELIAQDVASGGVRWRVPLLDTSPQTAADARVVDGDVITTIGTGGLVRFDGTAGAPEWGRDLANDRDLGVHEVVDARTEGVTAIAVSPAGAELRPDSSAVTPSLLNLAASTGEVRWQQVLGVAEALAPIDASERFVVHLDLARGPNPLVVVREARTGAEITTLPVDGDLHDLALLDDLVLVSSSASGLRAFDATSGEERWTAPAVAGDLVPAVAEDRVAVPSPTGLIVLDAAGTATGTVDLGGPPASASISQGVLTVATPGLSIRAHDLAGNLLWSRDLPPPSIASMATDGQLVAVNGPNGTIVVDGRSGERLTTVDRLDTDDVRLEVPGSVALDDGLVVVSPLGAVISGRGLAAIDGRTGLARWNRDGDQPPVFGSMTRTPGVVWVSVGDEVHGYELATGRRAFAALGGIPRGPVAVTPEVIVATPAGQGCLGLSSCQSAVLAIDRLTREPAWTSPAPACGPPAVRDGRVVVPTSTGPWALGITDGAEVWRATGPAACGPLALGTAHAVQGEGSRVLAWTTADGADAWSVDLGETLATSPVLADDEVVVATIDGGLVALDIGTGEIRWQFRLPAPALTDPVVVDNRWVVLLRDGRIVGLR